VVVGTVFGAATIATRSWRVAADESPFLVVAVVGIVVEVEAQRHTSMLGSAPNTNSEHHSSALAQFHPPVAEHVPGSYLVLVLSQHHCTLIGEPGTSRGREMVCLSGLT